MPPVLSTRECGFVPVNPLAVTKARAFTDASFGIWAANTGCLSSLLCYFCTCQCCTGMFVNQTGKLCLLQKRVTKNKKPPSVPQSNPLYSNISNSTALTKDAAQMQTEVSRSSCWLRSNAFERKTCIATACGTRVRSVVDLRSLCCWWWQLDFPRICQILDGPNLLSLSPEQRQSRQQVGS